MSGWSGCCLLSSSNRSLALECLIGEMYPAGFVYKVDRGGNGRVVFSSFPLFSIHDLDRAGMDYNDGESRSVWLMWAKGCWLGKDGLEREPGSWIVQRSFARLFAKKGLVLV